MEAVASQAGVALQNARLFRDNQRRVAGALGAPRAVADGDRPARSERAARHRLPADRPRPRGPQHGGGPARRGARPAAGGRCACATGGGATTRSRTSTRGTRPGSPAPCSRPGGPSAPPTTWPTARGTGSPRSPPRAACPTASIVPMTAGDRVLGVLSLRSPDRPFTDARRAPDRQHRPARGPHAPQRAPLRGALAGLRGAGVGAGPAGAHREAARPRRDGLRGGPRLQQRAGLDPGPGPAPARADPGRQAPPVAAGDRARRDGWRPYRAPAPGLHRHPAGPAGGGGGPQPGGAAGARGHRVDLAAGRPAPRRRDRGPHRSGRAPAPDRGRSRRAARSLHQPGAQRGGRDAEGRRSSPCARASRTGR